MTAEEHYEEAMRLLVRSNGSTPTQPERAAVLAAQAQVQILAAQYVLAAAVAR